MALHRGGLGSQGHEVTAKLLQRLPQRRPPLPPSAMFMKETGCNPIRWDQRRWHQESRDRSGASGMASSSLLITDQRCIDCRHPKTAEDFLKLSPGRKVNFSLDAS
ncbi:hypothetical protein OsJ_36677 [Oryza sativa Japonica Group]|uniref:Uncharacterized protein n=1 Tax=Oryza sativa subsp. japonica TaxID=39947 RepID=B9GE00_ORYSJ|nr:hypothetical protein OsJ_36677 [Oryza sativa Japonica Group]